MVVVTSQFRVANGMADAVQEAFLDRPGLVDTAPGFLGLEVFTDQQDPTLFYLVTRWTDFDTYEAWHGSADHRASHKFMPKGLKLDPAWTKLTRMEHLARSGETISQDVAMRNLAPLLAQALPDSHTMYFLETDAQGVIHTANQAFHRTLNMESGSLVGTPLWDVLTEPDGVRLREELQRGTRDPEAVRLLNFADRERHLPFTLSCRVDVQPDGLSLIGEEPLESNHFAQAELRRIHNELAVLNRENQRKSRELAEAKKRLEATLDELNSSYWHLRKIQEHLPVCYSCKKVKTGNSENDWADLLEYLSQNAMLFSHGLCPPCFEKEMAELDREMGKPVP